MPVLFHHKTKKVQKTVLILCFKTRHYNHNARVLLLFQFLCFLIFHQRLLYLFFLFQINTLVTKGCPVNKLSLPLRNSISIWAVGKWWWSFSSSDVAKMTSPIKAVWITRIFCNELFLVAIFMYYNSSFFVFKIPKTRGVSLKINHLKTIKTIKNGSNKTVSLC